VSKPAAKLPDAARAARNGGHHPAARIVAAKPARLVRPIVWASFARVVRPVYVGARRSLGRVVLDRRNRIKTEALVPLEELGLAAPNRIDYQPVSWLALRRILRRSEVTPDDVFLDFGSGMGRVVFLAAAQYRFKRVIGVELSSKLHAIATRNFERTTRRLRCPDVQLVNSDALDYELPDDVSVVFFNNPFTGDIFERVMRKLLVSLERNPRELRIIYANPIEEASLLAAGARRVRRVRGLRPGAEWSRSNAIHMYALSRAAM
jgi:SAM-dependent methyltransferase